MRHVARVAGAVGVAALAVLAASGASARADEVTADRVDALMAEAYDGMVAGGRLIVEADVLGVQGEAAASAARRAEALAHYVRAEDGYAQVLAALPQLTAVDAERRAAVERVARYNQACARARLGRTDDALASLGAALEAGYADLDRVAGDPDLDALRGEQRFEDLLARARARQRAAAAEEAGTVLAQEALFPYAGSRSRPWRATG